MGFFYWSGHQGTGLCFAWIFFIPFSPPATLLQPQSKKDSHPQLFSLRSALQVFWRSLNPQVRDNHRMWHLAYESSNFPLTIPHSFKQPVAYKRVSMDWLQGLLINGGTINGCVKNHLNIPLSYSVPYFYPCCQGVAYKLELLIFFFTSINSHVTPPSVVTPRKVWGTSRVTFRGRGYGICLHAVYDSEGGF